MTNICTCQSQQKADGFYCPACTARMTSKPTSKPMLTTMIRTTYYGPTNTKGSRIAASLIGKPSLVRGYDHALDSEGNHRAAMEALRVKLDLPPMQRVGEVGARGAILWGVKA